MQEFKKAISTEEEGDIITKLEISAISDKGCVRKDNEDMVLIGSDIFCDDEKEIVVDLEEKKRIFFVAIADGMGGHNAGAIASKMVLELMQEKINLLELGLTENELAKKIENWAYEIHCRILEEGNKNPERKGMGTTLVGVVFYGNFAYYLNVGDSRLYKLRDGYLVQISKDHSLKELTRDENAPSHIILNSFGGGDKVFVDFAPVSKKLFKEDILLLCSDGLSDMLTDNEIENILNTSENPVFGLLTEAKNKGGRDNISIVKLKIQ